ncbi:MAG: hypothetical protein ACYST6_00425, partial [Planctomycetota bacterium]
FDGCDHGNFSDWNLVTGRWTVIDPTKKMCYIENALLGRSEDRSFVFYKADNWSDYSLAVAVKSVVSDSTDGSVGICFGVRDPNHYHELKWRPATQQGTVRMAISRTAAGQTVELTAFEVPWNADAWHQVEVGLRTNKIIVRLDNSAPIETPLDYEVTGGIGLRLEGDIAAYFDDVHVRARDSGITM